MNRHRIACAAISLLLLAVGAPAQARRDPVFPHFEIRFDMWVNHDSSTGERCEASQAATERPTSFWGTFGEGAPGESGRKLGVTGAAARCGAGAFASASRQASDAAAMPLLIIELSATPGWDAGAMDPGPVEVAQVLLSITSRRLTGFLPDKKPIYDAAAVDRRTVRLGAGDEFVLPVALPAAPGPDVVGAREVMVRVRASRAEGPHAAEYGRLAVMTASPGSEVIVDGGVATRTGSDGSALLPNVLAGQREVRLRSPSRQTVVRFVTVVKGRTVVVSPETAGVVGNAQFTLTAAGTNPQGSPEFLRARDKAVMVRVPEGEFVMGNLETEGKPQPHPVYVSAFLMDKLPVTWGQFKRFSAATGTPLPPDPYWGLHDDHPVSFVRWDEARSYCEWAGARLPTEAEREKAARGTDGRKYPWGNEEPTPELGVFRRNWGYEGTDAVGIRPAGASPYGLLDTGGNVWEYCQDWWDADYYKSSPLENPLGPKTGRARVVRGGSWDSRPSVLSASCRNFAYVGYREGDFGFRCAADAPR